MLLYGRHCLVVSRLFYVSRSFACLFCFCFCFHFVLVLVSAVEYTTKLQRERQTMQEEADLLRKQIQELNASIRWVLISLWWSIKPVFSSEASTNASLTFTILSRKRPRRKHKTKEKFWSLYFRRGRFHSERRAVVFAFVLALAPILALLMKTRIFCIITSCTVR